MDTDVSTRFEVEVKFSPDGDWNDAANGEHTTIEDAQARIDRGKARNSDLQFRIIKVTITMTREVVECLL